jgi:hypothetical protein
MSTKGKSTKVESATIVKKSDMIALYCYTAIKLIEDEGFAVKEIRIHPKYLMHLLELYIYNPSKTVNGGFDMFGTTFVKDTMVDGIEVIVKQ